MEWITYEKRGFFWGFAGVQCDMSLSYQLSNNAEIDDATEELKRQIDVAASRMKMALQGNIRLVPS